MAQQYQGKRPRELGISFGIFKTGLNNAITDVKGVKVGQVTLIDDSKGMRTGVTAIVPHSGNIFQHRQMRNFDFLQHGFFRQAEGFYTMPVGVGVCFHNGRPPLFFRQ